MMAQTKNEGETTMKTAIIYAHKFLNKPHINLPNAATRRQVLQKYLDSILLCACGVGIGVAVLFLASFA